MAQSSKTTTIITCIISHDGSKLDPQNIATVFGWPTSRTITDVHGFSNLSGHYQRYIKDFAELARPLTGRQKGSRGKVQQLKGRKEKISTKESSNFGTSLKHPDMSKPFILDRDSSQYVISAVLQQEFLNADGKYRLHPIAYESKKLMETEQHYSS